jgi:hypothetical protein
MAAAGCCSRGSGFECRQRNGRIFIIFVTVSNETSGLYLEVGHDISEHIIVNFILRHCESITLDEALQSKPRTKSTKSGWYSVRHVMTQMHCFELFAEVKGHCMERAGSHSASKTCRPHCLKLSLFNDVLTTVVAIIQCRMPLLWVMALKAL